MLQFQALMKAHDRQSFDCGVPSLNQYLQRSARQNQDKDVGRTYVLVDEGESRIWGYYTLSSSTIDFDEYPENAGLPRYPVPAILLARLAVDKRRQGEGLGRNLLLHALTAARRHADNIAAAAVIVDALDDLAQAFYEKYGFQTLNKPGRHLYLTTKKIRMLP
ncbi:MAG: GNAT family N-acetyltransferase [Janthinobacterium lividum]